MKLENVDLQITLTWEMFEKLEQKAQFFNVSLSQYLQDLVSTDLGDIDDEPADFDNYPDTLETDVACASRN